MKQLGIALLVLLVIAAAAFAYVFTQAAPVIKSQVETIGTAATGTAVKLDNVSIAFGKGAIVLNSLRIANPPTYSAAEALSAGTISATVDPSSLIGKGPLILREVIIDSPSLSYEGNGLASNLSAIQDHIAGYVNTTRAASSGAEEGAKASERKIIIRDLYVRNGTVSIAHKEFAEPLVAELSEIHVRNIGEMSGGATYAEVAQSVLGAVMGAAARVAVEKMVLETGPVGAVVDAIDGLLGGGGEE